ncbi:MAG TPA: hypothetical protein VII99_06010 [Bacteroidia bacterium]
MNHPINNSRPVQGTESYSETNTGNPEPEEIINREAQLYEYYSKLLGDHGFSETDGT